MKTLLSVAVAVLALGGCGAQSDPLGQPSEAPPPSSDLLPPVTSYVTSVNAKDLDGLVRAFAEDGEVIDVGRRFAGHDAIRGWAEREVIGGTLTVTEIVENRPGYQRLLVRFAPGGTGGFAAHYAFTVSGNEIARADLTYA